VTNKTTQPDAATAANLLRLYSNFMESDEDEEKKADLHWRIQMKIIGPRPTDRAPETQYDRDRSKRLAELHPQTVATAEEEAEQNTIMAEIIAEAAREQADEAAKK